MVLLLKKVFLLLAMNLLLPVMALGQAQFPNRPVTIIVPFSSGGAVDIVARAVAKGLGDAWKQTVVVDYKAGAAGLIGTSYVAKAPPDGYTLVLYSDSNYAIQPMMYGKAAEETAKNLVAVSMLADAPVVIGISTKGKLGSLKNAADLIDYAKKSAQPLTFGTSGIGSDNHVFGEWLGFKSGLKGRFLHVPYKGTNPALADLVGGQVDMVIAGAAGMQGFVASGDVRILAHSSPRPFPLLPGLASIAQTVPGSSMASVDLGLAAPLGTPPAIIQQIHADVQRVLAMPDIVATLNKNGYSPLLGTTEDYRERIVNVRKERETMIVEAAVEMK